MGGGANCEETAFDRSQRKTDVLEPRLMGAMSKRLQGIAGGENRGPETPSLPGADGLTKNKQFGGGDQKNFTQTYEGNGATDVCEVTRGRLVWLRTFKQQPKVGGVMIQRGKETITP